MKELKIGDQIRQGDVLLERVNLPKDAVPQKQEALVVFALGEQTGHLHAVLDEKRQVKEYKKGEERYFRVGDFVVLGHGLKKEIEGKAPAKDLDHGWITVPPGDYLLIPQREHAPEGIRRVTD